MHRNPEFVASFRKQTVAVGGLELRHGTGLLAGWPERVVAAGDAQLAFGLGVVLLEVVVVDGPVDAHTALAGGVEIGLVESHDHPLPVERRAADTLYAGMI